MQSSLDELCLIDAGIQNLSDLPIRSHLRVLNLHGNHIQRIQNIDQARSLVHLDLSSNRIQLIENLSALVRLRTLNLSCNCLKQISGLKGLHSLIKLDVSYNCIEKLDGFKEVGGAQYQLKHVKLHGNRLTSVDAVAHCLSGCHSLCTVTLSDGSSTGSNPLCKDTKYVAKLFAKLSHVSVIDGHNSNGQSAEETDGGLANIPGLEEYAEFLASVDDVVPKPEMATPKIDAALSSYRNRNVTKSQTLSDLDSTAVSSGTMTKSDHEHSETHEDRLCTLEEQISNLLKVQGAKASDSKKVLRIAETVASNTDTDDSEYTPAQLAPVRPVKSSSQSADAKSRLRPSSQRGAKSVSSRAERGRQRYSERFTAEQKSAKYSDSSDRRMRDDLRTTYVQLMKELEGERERSTAAEQAVKRLNQQLEAVTQKVAEDRESQQTTIDAAVRLKRALTAEKDSRQKAQVTLELLREKIAQLQKIIDEKDKALEEARDTTRLGQETAAKAEQEHFRRVAELAQQAQEAHLAAAASGRELEMVKAESSNAKEQVRQLQTLLADREKAHQQEIEGKYPLHSQAVDDLIAKALAKAERDRLREEHAQTKKYDELAKKYADLEDEFRMALQVELERFKELQAAYEQTSTEAASNKAALEIARQKDEKSGSTVAELTTLVREQKARLTELSKAKAEQATELKERVQQLEAHLDEARRRMIQFEMLKKEHKKLQAALHAQESLVAGLKEEQKVWSEELAQQGATLAQDRGRLESRAESLQTELAEARKKSERDQDALRIKTKVIDDQTETIRKLKDGLVERDEQVKEARAEHLRAQRELETQLAAEASETQSLSEQLERERSRRDELKSLAADLQAKLTDEQHAHSMLQDRWREKSDAIAAVERQVLQMKSSWESKERKLIEERDRATETAAAAMAKLRDIDDAFRRQLDTMETSHRSAIAKLTSTKDSEIDEAKRRTAEVEDEMRVLLHETDTARQNMEARIRKLTSAFADLQQDLVR